MGPASVSLVLVRLRGRYSDATQWIKR